jgi:hypothetical protein
MLNDIQEFMNEITNGITTIEKKWVDVFKPNKKDNKNQVVFRLANREDTKCLSTGQIETSMFTFEIFVVGDKKRKETRDLSEQLYNALGSVYNTTKNNTIIIMTKANGHSFQFLENDGVVVNKFTLMITAQNK